MKVFDKNWLNDVRERPVPFDLAAFSMLSRWEEALLFNLVRDQFEGQGVIVDAGCFLGASTRALSSGLQQTEFAIQDGFKVHSYDLFVAPDDEYTLSLLPKGTTPGANIRHLFERNIDPVKSWVQIHEGDIKTAEVPEAPVELLFVDVAKCWLTNEVIIRHFFSKLVPESSIVIQQDFGTPFVPWVHVTMEFFADQFELLGVIGSSAVYRFKGGGQFDGNSLRNLALERKLELLEAAEARHEGYPQHAINASRGMLIFMEDSLEAALDYIQSQRGRFPGENWHSQFLDAVEGMARVWGQGKGLEDDMASKFERYLS